MAAMMTIIVILLAGIVCCYGRYAGERGANRALGHVLHQAQTERVRFVEAYHWRAEAAANRQREDEERQQQAERAPSMAIFQPLPARNSFRSSTNPFARASLFSPMQGRKTEDPRPELKEPVASPEVVADIHREQESGEPQPEAASAQTIFEPKPEEAPRPLARQENAPAARQEPPQRGEVAANVTGKPPVPIRPPMPSVPPKASRLAGIHSLGRRLKRQAPPPPVRQGSMASVAPNEDPVGKKDAKPEATVAHPEEKIAKPAAKLAVWDPRFTLVRSPLKRTWSMPMGTSLYDERLPVAFTDQYPMDESFV